nr:MAG TPA: Ead/Ea22-like protein [Caudoviricetes sp.]
MKMNEFKGTPGPWKVEDNGYFYDINAVRGTVGNVCSSISWFDNDEHRGPVAIANAQLIAAAPELLEALQLLMAEQTGGNKSCGHNGFTCMCSYNKARAAISKALGEAQ